MSLVIKLFLAIGLLVSSCEYSHSMQIGHEIRQNINGKRPYFCYNANNASCKRFTLGDAKVVCGNTVQNWPPATGVAYTRVRSAECMHITCHVEVETADKLIHASINCRKDVDLEVTYYVCSCTNFKD
uniref:Uncharacterized protein n=1 Tax=Cacopsylla melanoneura TaxID=428564 RepID=A0A8D9BS09_9HEMI